MGAPAYEVVPCTETWFDAMCRTYDHRVALVVVDGDRITETTEFRDPVTGEFVEFFTQEYR